jgi:hypothetical protein
VSQTSAAQAGFIARQPDLRSSLNAEVPKRQPFGQPSSPRPGLAELCAVSRTSIAQAGFITFSSSAGNSSLCCASSLSQTSAARADRLHYVVRRRLMSQTSAARTSFISKRCRQLSLRSQTSAARAGFIARQTSHRAPGHRCPKREPLGQASSREVPVGRSSNPKRQPLGQASSRVIGALAKPRSLVPNVSRSGRLHHA